MIKKLVIGAVIVAAFLQLVGIVTGQSQMPNMHGATETWAPAGARSRLA